MKIINRLLAAAAILLSAAACHTNEIDPVKPDPVNPGESGLTITANIVKTRVTYNDRDEDYLDQQWEVGDILFGYYGRNVDNKVILTVSGFDEAENAILIPAEDVGAATLKDLAKLEGTVPVDLVYIGANVSAAHYPFDTDGNLTIDMSPKDGVQDGVNIPACMHARAYVEIPDKHYPQNKSLFFKFENDCAIIEIYSLTGVKEEVNFDTELDSLSVSNLLLKGTYSLGDNGFTFAQTTGTSVADFSADLSETEWYVDSDGSIHNGNSENRYLIAVVPNDTQKQILVNTYINGDDEPHTFDYGEHDFDAGKCYVIRDADVVAKTVDGLYFTTVKAAFDHAHEIRSQHPDDNTVTLVKDEIYGLVNHDDSDLIDETIVIDYPVTLDLNGCWLNLGDVNEDGGYDNKNISESFIVSADGKFTISDPNEGEDMGGIWSDGNSAASIITNAAGGTVIIENGNIYQFGPEECDVEAEIENPVIIETRGSLSVNGGNLLNDVGIAIDSYEGSDTTIGTESGEGPDIDSGYISIFIHSDNTADNTAETIFEMKGGSVSGDVVAVKLDGKNVNGEVSGGNITALASGSTALLVQNYSTCIIYGGEITNTKIGVSDDSYAVHLAENAECIIKGGEIDGKKYSYAVYSEDSKCTISGGTIKSTSYTDGDPYSDYAGIPTIYCSITKSPQEVGYLFDMSGGSVVGDGMKLFLDKNVKGSITGGNIQTTGNHAIQLSGAILNIDGTDNTIGISNGSTKAGGRSYSTILIGNGSNCTISGEKATISNSTNGYAVEIKDSECMLSGGTIKTASFIHPAVYCYRSEDSSEGRTTPDLTIQWAEGSSESDRLREGPLIVCTYVPDDPTYIPSYLGAVSTKDLLYQESEEAEPETRTNYAKVEISGGYLYANDGAFYSQSQEGSLSITGSFYTNLGSVESPIKSPYFDFTQECLKYVSSENDDVDYGDYNFAFKISPSTDPITISLWQGSFTGENILLTDFDPEKRLSEAVSGDTLRVICVGPES